MDKLVVIMRGISGSGKSTYVTQHYPEAIICSADEYFNKNGEFEYNPEKIELAHISCFSKFLMAISQDNPLIVVDNTNIECWEVSPYYLVAKSFGYKVMVITLKCNYETATKRNKHGVPLEMNKKYAETLEPSLPFWREMVIPTD